MTDLTPTSPSVELQRAARLVILTMERKGGEAELMLDLVPEDELRKLISYVLAAAAITVETVSGDLPAIAHLRQLLNDHPARRP